MSLEERRGGRGKCPMMSEEREFHVACVVCVVRVISEACNNMHQREELGSMLLGVAAAAAKSPGR